MATPIMAWDSDDAYAENVVWWSKLDGRYQIEVQGHPKDWYRGTLYVFDHADGDKLISEAPVGISFGATFGPDMEDIATWKKMAIDIIDENE